jgi:hypothetical protein
METEMKGFVSFRPKLYVRLGGFLSRIGLGRIPGAGRLYNLLYSKFIKPKGVVLLDIQGNKMYVDGMDGGTAAVLLEGSAYEKYETELFEKMVQDGMVMTAPSTD